MANKMGGGGGGGGGVFISLMSMFVKQSAGAARPGIIAAVYAAKIAVVNTVNPI